MIESVPKVHLEAPSRISPTQVDVARRCRLRFLLESCTSESERCLPSSFPARYVGTAFHGVVEAARKGDAGVPPDRSQLEIAWTDLIVKVERDAEYNGDGCWLPLESNVRDLERTRLRSIRLGAQQTARVGRGTMGGSTEAWLESSDRLVRGKVDAIEYVDGDLTLIDLKSGNVFDETGTVKPSYVSQMLIYAALHRESRGSWPDALALVDKAGTRVPLAYERASAAKALLDAKEVLSGVAALVPPDADSQNERLTRLAAPSDDVCGACRHRPLCSPYMNYLLASGIRTHGTYRLDVAGTVVQSSLASNGSVSLVLSHSDIECTIQGLRGSGAQEPNTVRRLPSTGELVSVFDLGTRRPLTDATSPRRLVARPSSRAFATTRVGALSPPEHEDAP